MDGLLWQMVKEEIKMFRELAVLNWMYYKGQKTHHQ
jgi:hypothetical protein